MNISLRLARADDAERVFAWRNDPSVRSASFDSREIAWEEHRAWFLRTLERVDRSLLIAEQEEKPVGVVRFDVVDEVVEVSIFLDPALTGQGYGTTMLREGVTWVRRNLAGVHTLRAKVKPDNPASMKIFENAGFSESLRVYDLNL